MREVKLIKIGDILKSGHGLYKDVSIGQSVLSFISVNRQGIDTDYLREKFDSIFECGYYPFVKGYDTSSIYDYGVFDQDNTIKNGFIDDNLQLEVDSVFRFSPKDGTNYSWSTSKINYVISDDIFITRNSVYLIYDSILVRQDRLKKLGI